MYHDRKSSACNFMKNRLRPSSFPVNFEKFEQTKVLWTQPQNHQLIQYYFNYLMRLLHVQLLKWVSDQTFSNDWTTEDDHLFESHQSILKINDFTKINEEKISNLLCKMKKGFTNNRWGIIASPFRLCWNR